MLYICKYSGYNHLGVADTDDGVVDIVSLDELRDAMSSCHLEVRGIELRDSSMGMNIMAAFPYQLPETETVLQRKTSFMKNVDVVLHDGVVMYIRIHSERIKEPVTLRLSEFATRLGDCIFRGNPCPKKHKVTLVLDDSLEFTDKTFEQLPFVSKYLPLGVTGLGVVFDLRLCKRDDIVKSIYRTLYAGVPQELDASIIDIEERKKELSWVVGHRGL